MSYDLAAWYSDFAMSADDAGTFYGHICGDWVIVREHPAIREFCHALMAEFPGVLDPAILNEDFLQTPATHLLTYGDLVKHSAAPHLSPAPKLSEEPPAWRVIAGFRGLAMIMSLGSRKSEIGSAIHRLASMHGLVGYDPQDGEVALPPQLVGRPCEPLPEPVRMVIEEQPENLSVRVSFDGRPLFEGSVPSRRKAHDLAREHTVALDRLAYEVEDKRTLSSPQLTRPQPNDFVFNLLQGYANERNKTKDGS